MDIAALSMSMSNVKLGNSFGIGVMKKALDQVEQTGSQLVEMMDSMDDAVLDVSV